MGTFKSSKSNSHVRSSSLPSKTHPLAQSVEQQLAKLRASDSVCQKLSGLKDLYERVDDLFQLPLTQQALSHENCVNEMLDGSLVLLDLCSTSKDVFSLMKESIQELESSLRRKRNTESTMESEIKTYMVSRKRLNKVISKCFARSKRMEKNNEFDKDSDLGVTFRQMKEVEEISHMVFESLLSLIPQPKTRSWNAVSKLFRSRQVPCENANKVEKMEAELLLLIGKKSSLVQVQNVTKGLETLESSFQQIQEETECVYRRLLKTRVSLLNIFS